jgi:hypothetical protein
VGLNHFYTNSNGQVVENPINYRWTTVKLHR